MGATSKLRDRRAAPGHVVVEQPPAQVAATLATQYSRQFLDGMVARMEMSYFKYGDFRDAYPSKIDALESLQLRLSKYRETGNTEFLIDAANFAMIEFMRPSISSAAFSPTDSDQSPGRVDAIGNVSARPNIERYDYGRNGD